MPFCSPQKINRIYAIEDLIFLKTRDDKWFMDLPDVHLYNERDVAHYIANLICTADPTKSKGYNGWILESYLDYGIEDLDRVKQSLQFFDKIMSKLTPHQAEIAQYCGLIECGK